jgi:hypothetical protein
MQKTQVFMMVAKVFYRVKPKFSRENQLSTLIPRKVGVLLYWLAPQHPLIMLHVHLHLTLRCARDNLRGQKSLGPLKMSLEMAHKVILPPKKNYIPQFLKQRDINSYFPLLLFQCLYSRDFCSAMLSFYLQNFGESYV